MFRWFALKVSVKRVKAIIARDLLFYLSDKSIRVRACFRGD